MQKYRNYCYICRIGLILVIIMEDLENTMLLENPSLEELVLELKRIGTLDDRMERAKEVEALKSSFYKQLSKLKAEHEAAGTGVSRLYT